MFTPSIERFFSQRKQCVFPHTRIALFLDIDGVVRIRKGPVPREVAALLHTLARKHKVRIILITGAPAHHLPNELLRPNLLLHRAFAESGAVERMHDGTLVPHEDIVHEFRRLETALGFTINDGLAPIAVLDKTIIREGRRLTSFTAIMGTLYPPQPEAKPSATHEETASWLASVIHAHNLPFILLEGREQSYSYIDAIHKDVGKAWRVHSLLRETPHAIAFYIGDGTGDEEAMALPGIIPVALENSTARIKAVSAAHGFRVAKAGPDGTYEFLSGLKEFLQRIR